MELTPSEAAQLQSFARSRSLPASLCQRARIVLDTADGESNSAIASLLGLSKATIGKWRASFLEKRIAGLYDDLRPERSRSIDDERIAQLIHKTLHDKPKDGATHWSVRSVTAETSISKSSVQRYLQTFGLQPHRSESFKLSTDPFFGSSRNCVGAFIADERHQALETSSFLACAVSRMLF